MGKNSTPSYNPPPPPKLPTADELYASGTKYAKENSPLAFGARESALSDLSKGNDYYAGFQPTSFEQALSNQYFQNVWPDTEESIKHGLSLSGLDSSPILASMLGKARGGIETQIGQYLSDLGNTRATNSLNARLGIDPMSLVSPYVSTGMSQGNAQASLDYNYQQQLAQAAYQQALAKQQQSQGMFGSLASLGGAGLGALLAAPTGGMSLGMGALLGGLGGQAVAPLFGGASNPSSTSTLAQLALLSNGGLNGMFSSPVNPTSVSRFGGGINPYLMPSLTSTNGLNFMFA